MSSASSTARWMDCTVDSMFTTTPFLRPREGWLPMPMTSMAPSAVISPTSASTLEVPISRPTTMSRSVFLANAVRSFMRRWRRSALREMTTALPAHGKPIAVAQIDVGHVRGALTYELGRHQHESFEARVDLLAAQTHLHAVV